MMAFLTIRAMISLSTIFVVEDDAVENCCVHDMSRTVPLTCGTAVSVLEVP